jgi:hypothetical protein
MTFKSRVKSALGMDGAVAGAPAEFGAEDVAAVDEPAADSAIVFDGDPGRRDDTNGNAIVSNS